MLQTALRLPEDQRGMALRIEHERTCFY
jgi:hypothetical protein